MEHKGNTVVTTVFLKILNVRFGTVFTNPVTYVLNSLYVYLIFGVYNILQFSLCKYPDQKPQNTEYYSDLVITYTGSKN